MSVQVRLNDITDWIVITLRWLTLLGLTISAATGEGLSLSVIVILLFIAIFNLALSLLVAFDRRLPFQPYLSVFIDLVAACLLYFFSGAIHGNIGWAIVLPSMTASIYFGLTGGAAAAVMALFLMGLLSIPAADILSTLFFLVSLIPLCLVVVLLFGYLSQRLQSEIAQTQRAFADSKLDGLHTDSGWLSAIFKLVAELSASLNYQRVLEKALDLSSGAVGGKDAQRDRLVSAVLLYSEKESGNPQLQVGSARRFTHADMRVTLPGTSGLIGQAIDEGEAHLSKEIANDPELGRIVALRSCHSAYCIPLRTGLDTFGVLLFGHPKAEFFSPERQKVLDMIASQSMIAIQNALLYRDLEQEKERMIEIQEEARSKLARDLHDGPTQSVAAIAMRVNYARRLVERDPQAAARELYKIEELSRQTAREIRHMLFTLRPLMLESQGLDAALQAMAEKMGETYNQDVIIAVDSTVASRLELSRQGVIFNITEEAVNNARKHAQAAHIWVRLRSAEGELALLEIEDDGVGFDLQAVSTNYESRGSLGMVNMRERTELVNGYLKIDSKPGKGTLITVVIPLSEGAVDRARHALK